MSNSESKEFLRDPNLQIEKHRLPRLPQYSLTGNFKVIIFELNKRAVC